MNFAGRLATETAAPAGILAIRVDPRWLMATIFLLLGVQNLLLWRFLGFAPAWVYPVATACVAGVALFLCRAKTMGRAGPEVRTILLLGGASLLIFLLGGEGRLFYANADWQVRDAVLHDLIVNPWPFAYRQDHSLELLRAPIGMFLIPAVAGKAFGAAAADFALLIQNSLLLTLLLSLGSTLVAGARARVVTLTVIVLFSGMDIIGEMLRVSATGSTISHHLENWSGSQFSSHITQAFWVPQHALAGWFGALLFLLWRDRRISLGQMYVMLPMLMLLSPLGLMGTLPFAAAAGIVSLVERRLRHTGHPLSRGRSRKRRDTVRRRQPGRLSVVRARRGACAHRRRRGDPSRQPQRDDDARAGRLLPDDRAFGADRGGDRLHDAHLDHRAGTPFVPGERRLFRRFRCKAEGGPHLADRRFGGRLHHRHVRARPRAVAPALATSAMQPRRGAISCRRASSLFLEFDLFRAARDGARCDPAESARARPRRQ